jgi:tRNA threonylcarbamoyladenosine biosynthesis protein TsaE
MITLHTRRVEETADLGTRLARVLSPGNVVLLIGGLGVGKTALSQGIALGLGVPGRVTSPTFTMVATHRAHNAQGIGTLLHADLYRVGSGVEADDLAIGELVEDHDADGQGVVAVVEWGDVAPEVLGSDRLIVTVAFGDDEDDRMITIDSSSSSITEDEVIDVFGLSEEP